MQVTLSESHLARKRTGGGAVVSVLLHTVLLAVAITGTGRSEPAHAAPEFVDTLIYTPHAPTPAPKVTSRSNVMTYGEVPTSIPAIPEAPILGVTAPEIGRGMPTIADPGGEFVPAPLSAPHAGQIEHSTGIPYDATTVDRVVVPAPGNPMPRYPRFLASAGVEGRVITRFVVDTLGRVEARSIQVMQSTHGQFEQAVRDVLTKVRFTAAEVRGVKVRQLVEQTFLFELNR